MKKLYILIVTILLCTFYTTNAQVTGGSFTATCTDQGTVSWANGTNTTIIFAKAGSAISSTAPSANISTYTASTTFGLGTVYENDPAAFCIFKNSAGTSLNLSGLSPGVTYHFLAFDATGTTYSASHTFSGASLSTPGDVTVLSATAGNGQADVSWTNPSCLDEVMIVAKQGSSVSAGTPSGDGSSYTANLDFTAGGTAFGGGKVVYKGSTSPKTITGLTNGLTYFFKVFTRKGTTWSAGVETSATLPPGNVTGASFSATCTDAGTVSWTNPSATYKILVFAKATSAITIPTPTVDESTYTTADPVFGNGDPYENDASAFLVYAGTGNTVNISGLTSGTTYHFLVFNVSGTNYSSGTIFNNPTNSSIANVTGLTPTPATTSVSVSWSNPASCYDEIMVVAKASTIAAAPSGDGSAYTAVNDFTGGGTTFDTSGKVVYKGTGTSVNVINLTVNTMYFFKVFTRKGTTWSSGVEVSTTTLCTPANVTALKVTDAATTARLYWTDPSCFDEFLIVAKQGTASTPATFSATPSGDGSAYSANASFTNGSSTVFDGGKVVFKSGTNPGGAGFQITNLTTGLIYTFEIWTRRGTNWSSGKSITTVPGPPVIISVDPADNSTGVPTDQVFTVTFNEHVFISATGASGSEDDIVFDQPGSDPSVPRGSTMGTPSGDGYISRSGDVATITLLSDLDINEVNNILIGSKVFADSSANNFGGTTAGVWNFTTAAGVTITAPTAGACSGQFVSLGQIVLTEAANNNFQGTDNGSFSLILGFDKTGWVFKPGTSGVSVSVDPGGDIQSVTVSSITFTTATFTVQFKNVSNDGQAKDDHDVVTISGLKVSKDGSTASPAIIVAKAATNITIQGITEDVTALGTVNDGSASAAPTITWPGNDNSYCVGTDLGTITVTASGGSGYKWYNDIALTSPIGSEDGNATPFADDLGFSSASAGSFTKYATNSSGGCESTPTPFTLTITSAPVVNAGNAVTGVDAVCPGTQVPLGGTPTATGGLGSYTYSWTSTPAGFTSSGSNPNYTAANAGGTDLDIIFTVLVQDANCSASDNVLVTVKNISQPVVVSQPSTYSFTSNGNPINLGGTPSGGVFSGVGVIQLDTAYQFDPELAGVGTWPITYTATLSNGCTKSTSQDFDVFQAYDVFPELETEYCNSGENAVQLTVAPDILTDIQNYINTWNSVYVPNYGYSPLKTSWTGIIRNAYEGYYGVINSVSTGAYPNTYFYPWTIQTGQAYTGGGYYGTCPTCYYAEIGVFLEFENPILYGTYPYNLTIGENRGYVFWNNSTGKAAFEYAGEFVYVNPVPVVNFSGLASQYCNVNVDYDLTGNLSGGFYEISSNNGTTYGDVPGDGIKDATEGVNPGLAVFNPFDAFGSAASQKTVYIRYGVDPGTTGSSTHYNYRGVAEAGCIGYQERVTDIFPSTPIVFTPLTPSPNTEFCYEGASSDIEVETNPGGVNPTTGVVYTGFGIADNGTGKGKFTPKTAFDQKNPPDPTQPQTINIKATYTNSNGCSYSINRDLIVRPTPVVDFQITPTPPDNNFCYNDPQVDLTGNQVGGAAPGTTYQFDITYQSLGYTKNIPSNSFTFNPATYYDDAVNRGASNVSDAQFNINFKLTDPIGCTSTTNRLFTVSPLAVVKISGINDGDIFCSNANPFKVTFIPTGGTLKVNSNITALNPADNSISSLALPVSNNFPIEYEYKSGVSQCVTTKTYTISQVAAPDASFTTAPVCDGDVATFTASSYPFNYSWKWVLGDSIRSGTDKESINHVFPGLSTGATQTSYLIKLIIENNPAALKVCRDSAEATQVIGAYPNVDFNYSDICSGDFTKFTISSNIPVASAQWDFADGYTLPNKTLTSPISGADTHGGLTQGQYGSPQHQFVPNRYNVTLTARTAPTVGACADAITRQVGILTNITPTPSSPYMMSALNNGDGLWIEEDRSGASTWEFAVPNGKSVIDNSVGKAWITNSTSTYTAKDNSYMNSPCFNLTAFAKPVFSLEYWSNSDVGKDGAVLQFSTDGGQTWSVLGTPTSGVNWYSNNTIAAAPGGWNQFGWTGRAQTGWKVGKNSLDAIFNKANVRFRIAFASDEREEFDGFAFNDVVIEERNRIMLVEHFTNSDTDNLDIPESNGYFNTDAALNDLEVVKIEYHTSFPDADIINLENPSDNNARAAYYGLNGGVGAPVPLGLIDGGRDLTINKYGFVQTIGPHWWLDYKQKRSLSSSPYTMMVETLPTTDPTQIIVHAVANRVAPIVGNKPKLIFAVIEKDANGSQHVMRKLLPSPAGIDVNPLATVIDEQVTWQAEGLNDLSDLAVIAFIQDEHTHEVHQAAIELNPANVPTQIVTTLEDNEYSQMIELWPNPASKTMYIELPANVSKPTSISLTDGYGRKVFENQFEVGERQRTISTDNFATGVYILQIGTPNGGVVRKKVSIVH